MQRGWTQGDLAKLLNTTQAAVSRLEDPSYGRYSLKTLVELAKTFDAGMQVRFVSFVTMLHETFAPNAQAREVPTFEEEAPHVGFYAAGGLSTQTRYIPTISAGPAFHVDYFHIPIERPRASVVPISFPPLEQQGPDL